jgi:hypothetical protein
MGPNDLTDAEIDELLNAPKSVEVIRGSEREVVNVNE